MVQGKEAASWKSIGKNISRIFSLTFRRKKKPKKKTSKIQSVFFWLFSFRAITPVLVFDAALGWPKIEQGQNEYCEEKQILKIKILHIIIQNMCMCKYTTFWHLAVICLGLETFRENENHQPSKEAYALKSVALKNSLNFPHIKSQILSWHWLQYTENLTYAIY